MSFDAIKQKLGELWNEGVRRRLVVDKDGKRYANIPIVIVVFVAIFAFWLVAALAVIAYVIGCRFSIELDDDSDVFLPLAHTAGPTPGPQPTDDATYVPPMPGEAAEKTAAATSEAAAEPVAETPAAGEPEGPQTARPAKSLDEL